MRTRLEAGHRGEEICAAMWAMLRHRPQQRERRGLRLVPVRRLEIGQLSMSLCAGPGGSHGITARLQGVGVVAQFRITADCNQVDTVYLARCREWLPALYLGIDMLRAGAGMHAAPPRPAAR